MIREVVYHLPSIIKRYNLTKYTNEVNSFQHNGLTNNEAFYNLLEHAIKTTKFYKDYKLVDDIKEVPVITKYNVQKYNHDFISNTFNEKKLIRIKTSGSYGTPLVLYMDKNKKKAQLAALIYFGNWSNYTIGKRHGFIRVRGKSKIKQFCQNEIVISPNKVTIDWIKDTIDLIKRKKIKVLIGYPSIIGALANYLICEGDTYKLDGVICTSEILTSLTRESINKAFLVDPLSRYSTEEFGVLANECQKEHNHHINTAQFIVEVLKINEDKPASEGEFGRIVVTDLYSHAFPLIRYETGDLGVLGTRLCSCGLKSPYIECLCGRIVEVVYDTKQNAISSYIVVKIFSYLSNVIQYQFIQEDEKKYILRVVSKDLITNIDEVISLTKKYFGDDAQVLFEYVDEIKPLVSGKRPYIIQKCNKLKCLNH